MSQMNLFGPTLAEAKLDLQRKLEKGDFCPCCNQFAKKYKRKMYATPCVWLICLYHLHCRKTFDEFFHITEIVQHASKGYRIRLHGDSHKANYFGLIEEKPKDMDIENKRTSGFWRITERGIAFVKNELRIPKYALIYNSEVVGFEGDEVSIQDCLGVEFNYTELMNGI